MLFNSLEFFIFFAILITVYYLVPKKVQWVLLLVASFFFYIYFSWKFAFFIMFTIITVYLGGLYLSRVNKKEKELFESSPDLTEEEKKAISKRNKRKKKAVFILVLLANIGILFLLKYLNFFIESLNGIVSWFGAGEDSIPFVTLLLPLGISFYTFQTIGYLIDLYWGKIEVERNIFKFALFVSFFPQILQGPISRYNDLAPQLAEKHKFDYQNFTFGLQRILWGLFKKMIIADGLGMFVVAAFGDVGALNGGTAVIAVLFYAIQDYADFSGCMDIAIGVAQCMGIKLPENFRRPYFSRTIEEYWRRWHITLGTWFKDYIFYPISTSRFSMKLGKWTRKVFKGNFGKQVPAILALLVVWFTTGMWHGASWTYILWGLYYGVIIILSILLKPLFAKIITKLKINVESWWYKTFQLLRTFWLVCIGRIIFRAESLSDAWMLFCKTFEVFRFDYSLSFILDSITLPMLIVCLSATVILLIIDIIKERNPDKSIREGLSKQNIILRWSVYFGLIIAVVLFGAYGPDFTAMDFGYMQF